MLIGYYFILRYSVLVVFCLFVFSILYVLHNINESKQDL